MTPTVHTFLWCSQGHAFSVSLADERLTPAFCVSSCPLPIQCEINVLLTELEAAMEMQESVLGGQSGKPGPEEEEEVKSDPTPEAEEDQGLTAGPALLERKK